MSKFLKNSGPEEQSRSFHIRRVRPGDEADIYRLLHGDDCPLPADDPRHPAREAERLVEASLDPEPFGMGWLAITSDGKAAGIITTKEGFNGGIFVDDSYRRMGIAEGLVGAREDFQRRRGDTTATAHIRADNTASIRLHQKLGYAFDANSAGDPSQKPADAILVMVKPLAEKPGSLAPGVSPRKTVAPGR